MPRHQDVQSRLAALSTNVVSLLSVTYSAFNTAPWCNRKTLEPHPGASKSAANELPQRAAVSAMNFTRSSRVKQNCVTHFDEGLQNAKCAL